MFININFFIFEGSYDQVGMNTKKNTKRYRWKRYNHNHKEMVK